MAIRILVAEDQAGIRDMLVMDLRNANDEVLIVAVGTAALESQNAQASDLLLTTKSTLHRLALDGAGD